MYDATSGMEIIRDMNRFCIDRPRHREKRFRMIENEDEKVKGSKSLQIIKGGG